MHNIFKHKGYIGSVEYDDRDGILHGRMLGISDIISYEGTSVQKLKKDFQNAVEDYLDACREIDKEPEKPFSGRFMVRIPRELHATIALTAKGKKKSLNAWVSDALAQAAQEHAKG